MEKAVVLALVTFATAVGAFALVGVLLAVLDLAARTAGAIAAAGIGGVSVAIRWKR